MKEVKRGDIYYIKSFPRTGSEQNTGRPAVVISNNKNNKYSPTVEVVFLTTRSKAFLPTHTVIKSCPRQSLALCEQVTTVDKSKLDKFVGTVSRGELRELDKAVMISLGVPIESYRPDELIEGNYNDELMEMMIQLSRQLRAMQDKYDALKRFYDLYRLAV